MSQNSENNVTATPQKKKKMTPLMWERAKEIRAWQHRNMTYADVATELYHEFGVSFHPTYLQQLFKKEQRANSENSN